VGWLNLSDVSNFRRLSMDFAIDKPGVLRFIRNSPFFGKMSISVRRVNEKPEPDGLWFTLSSGAQIRTEDLRVMSNAPESVPFVRRILQISQTDERWFLIARHAAVVNR
jgi:hypothetical protein